MKEVIITEEPIALHKLLKLENLTASGGEAKYVISEGMVRVNQQTETRKRKKIFAGDLVEFAGRQFRVQVQGNEK
ncbi:MAG: RNA-binding S4 domain-containing protein [Desulfosalsimonas sp.]|uniref:RNA-binding S4 domain-containing protein n=1 Tax=Desulfosalsimonas sp. TaxID=3073848 RepID=UPI003970C64B